MKSKHLFNSLLPFFFFSLLIISTKPHPVIASSFNLSIYPPVTQISIKPGTTVTQVINIQNQGEDPVTLTPKIVPFKAADDQGHAQLLPEQQPQWLSYFSLANSQITLNQPFTLTAGKKDQLVLNIVVPETAPLGDHYASILLTSTPANSNQTTSQNQIVASLASHLLITIGYNADPATVLKVQNFELTSPQYFQINNLHFVDSLTPLTFKATINNVGKYLAATHNLISLKKSNQTTQQLSVLSPAFIISNSQRSLTASPSGTITIKPNLTAFGKYTVELTTRSDNASTNSSIQLFFLPLKTITALLAIAILIILLTITIKKQKTSNQYQ